MGMTASWLGFGNVPVSKSICDLMVRSYGRAFLDERVRFSNINFSWGDLPAPAGDKQRWVIHGMIDTFIRGPVNVSLY